PGRVAFNYLGACQDARMRVAASPRWLVVSGVALVGFVVLAVYVRGAVPALDADVTARARTLAAEHPLWLWTMQRLTTIGGNVALAVAVPLLVAITRVALLAHWPTDVVGGWLIALAVVPPIAVALDKWVS